MNYADYQAVREREAQQARERREAFDRQNPETISTLDKEHTRIYTEGRWRVRIGPAIIEVVHLDGSGGVEQDIHSFWVLHGARDGAAGARLIAMAVVVYRAWVDGAISEMPPSGWGLAQLEGTFGVGAK